MNIKELSKQVYQNNKEKGFWEEDREIMEIIFLVKSEVFEMYERFRKHGFEQVIPESGLAVSNKEEYKAKYKNSFYTEHADVIIRLLDIIGYFDKDIKFDSEEDIKEIYFKEVDGKIVCTFTPKKYMYRLDSELTYFMNFTTPTEKLSELGDPYGEYLYNSLIDFLQECLYVHRTFFEPEYNSVYEKISYNTQREYKHGKQF